MTTSLQYQQAVRRALGLAGTDVTALPQADVLEAVNGALQAISTERDWSWQFASATGVFTPDTQTIAAPTGYTRTYSLSVLYEGDERELTQQTSYHDIDSDDETPAEPLYFSHLGPNLYFWPIPDDAYQYRHFYFKNEPILTADGDVPLLPDQFGRWLIVEAASRLYIRTVSPEKHNELRVEAEEWRQRAHKYDFRNRLPLPEIALSRESVWQDI